MFGEIFVISPFSEHGFAWLTSSNRILLDCLFGVSQFILFNSQECPYTFLLVGSRPVLLLAGRHQLPACLHMTSDLHIIDELLNFLPHAYGAPLYASRRWPAPPPSLAVSRLEVVAGGCPIEPRVPSEELAEWAWERYAVRGRGGGEGVAHQAQQQGRRHGGDGSDTTNAIDAWTCHLHLTPAGLPNLVPPLGPRSRSGHRLHPKCRHRHGSRKLEAYLAPAKGREKKSRWKGSEAGEARWRRGGDGERRVLDREEDRGIMVTSGDTKSKKGKIGRFILEFLAKGQVRPSTLETVSLVPEL